MKVLIVGGVAGGAGTAARLRRNDETAEIILFEKGEYISFANCGLPYYIGGTITEKSALLLQTPESFHRRFRVDVRVRHQVLAVDTATKTVEVRNNATGECYTERYDQLVLSPGAAPIRPPFPGMEETHVFTLRSIPDTYAIKEHLERCRPKTCAVIGAGFIGLEMAENLVEQGVRVSVIEAADHVMAPLDLEMAHEVHNYLRAKGIGLVLGQKCTGMTAGSVLLEDGSAVAAEMVILSIGVKPETGFLDGSGIALGSRGELLVNEHMETSVPGVYGLGDAASVRHIVDGRQVLIPLASPANKQARIVADNLCGKEREYRGSQGTAILKLFDMTVAVTGEKEEDLRQSGVEYHKVLTYSASHAGYYPGGTMMAIKLLFSQSNLRILGAQIVGGKGVDKRIDLLANAVRFGQDIYDLQEMELAYAPPFSSAKDPVNMAGYVAGNVAEGMARQFFLEDLPELPADAIRLDVRTPWEFERGRIPGFINLPLDSLRERLDELDLDRKIYITCQIGLRGYLAQRILMQHGAETWNLAGGYRLYAQMETDRRAAAAHPRPCTECGIETTPKEEKD